MHQSSNMRAADVPRGIAAHEHEDYGREVEQARAEQTVPFAVAPRMSVQSRRGVLTAGAEVTVDDIPAEHKVDPQGSATFDISGPMRFHRLVREGVILERL